MEYWSGENLIKEVGLVEDIFAICRVVVRGAIERGLSGIDRAGQRTVPGIDVLIEFLIVREHRRVFYREPISKIVVDKCKCLLHGYIGAVQIGTAEKSRQIVVRCKWTGRIEACR